MPAVGLFVGLVLLLSGIIYAGSLNWQFYLPNDACFQSSASTCLYKNNNSMAINVLLWLGLSLFLACGGIAITLLIVGRTVQYAAAPLTYAGGYRR